jgi:hypothetical protein
MVDRLGHEPVVTREAKEKAWVARRSNSERMYNGRPVSGKRECGRLLKHWAMLGRRYSLVSPVTWTVQQVVCMTTSVRMNGEYIA